MVGSTAKVLIRIALVCFCITKYLSFGGFTSSWVLPTCLKSPVEICSDERGEVDEEIGVDALLKPEIFCRLRNHIAVSARALCYFNQFVRVYY